MKKFAVVLLLLTLVFTPAAFAKRSPPEPVAPIRSGELEYRVNHAQMGCVEAWDVKKDALVWRRQIYAVKYNVELERDVQDTYIKSVELQDGALHVKNERGSEYQLNLDSLDVKVVKGKSVEAKN